MKFFKKIVMNGLDIFCKDSDARSDISDIQSSVATMSGDVTDIKEDVDDIQRYIEVGIYDNILIIGDSYSTDNYATPTWASVLQTKLGLDNNHFRNFSRGSISFGYNGGVPSDYQNGLNFCDVLNYAANQLTQTERDAISVIIVGGGANDYVANDESDIAVGIGNFVSIAHSNFSNAKIECYIIGWTSSDNRVNYMSNYATYVKEFSKYECKCYKVFSVIVPRSMRIADGVHPTVEGHAAIADSIYGIMKGGVPQYPTDVYVSSFQGIRAKFIDAENVLVYFSTFDQSTDEAVNISNTKAKLLSFTNEIIGGYEVPPIGFNAGVTLVATTPTVTAYNAILELVFAKDNDSLGLYCLTRMRNDDGTRKTFQNIVQFSNPAISCVVPIYLL